MLKTYDSTTQAFVERDKPKYYDNTIAAWVDVASAKTYDSTEQAWIEHISSYMFKRYTHDSPGGAVETISADGSSVTIDVPERNFGGGSFIFESDIPPSAAGQDLTISFTLLSSYTGNLTNDYIGDIYITCRSWGLNVIGSMYDRTYSTEYVYTVPASKVEDRVNLSLGVYCDLGDTSNTFKFVLSNVTINGKPCKFNFK